MGSSTLFLDIENDGDTLLCVGYAFDEGDVVVTDGSLLLRTLDLDAGKDAGAWALPAALASPDVTKVTQSDHDLRWFLMHGFRVAGPWHDTKVMAWCVDENQPLDQGSLLDRYVGFATKEKTIRSIGNRLFYMGTFPLDEYASWPENIRAAFIRYNRNDVSTLRDLYKSLARALIEAERLDYWRDQEVPYSSVLLNMEVRGLPVNLDDTAVLAEEVRAERDRASAHLRTTARLPATFNLNSPKQLRQYLFSKWFTIPDRIPMNQEVLPSDQDFEVTKVARDYIHGVWTLRGRGLAPTDPPKRKDKDDESGEPSTAAPDLLYKHPHDPWVRELVLGYKRNDKLLGTYLDKFPKVAVGRNSVELPGPTWRIYGRFNQTGTVTGRLSSSQPNLQNIPARREIGKRVRALFQGNLVIGDYDSLEMRIMAHYSRDSRLTDVFLTGGDPHALTATAIFGGCDGHDDPRRDQGKLLNYSIGYGAGARKVAQSLTLAGYPTTAAEAKDYLGIVKDFYPRLYTWMNHVIWEAKKSGMVTTLGGRGRHLRGQLHDVASWKQQAYGERQAVNSIIQGSAADILRRVMLRVGEFEPTLTLIAQVHDELLWEYERRPAPETLRVLQAVCEAGHGFKLRVPLVFEPVVCSDWSQKGEGIDLSLLTEEDE